MFKIFAVIGEALKFLNMWLNPKNVHKRKIGKLEKRLEDLKVQRDKHLQLPVEKRDEDILGAIVNEILEVKKKLQRLYRSSSNN